MPRLAALLAICAAAFPASARCIPLGGRECVPPNRLGREFFDAVSKSRSCLDVLTVNTDGTVTPNGVPPADRVPAFIAAHRDEAVGLYEGAASTCLMTTIGHRALYALATLQSDASRAALERLWLETRNYDRTIVVRAMLEDPAFRAGERLDALWKNELNPRVRHAIAANLRARRDPAMLASIAAWIVAESDPETRRALELARDLIEHPDRCFLTRSGWTLRSGARCTYSCDGTVDTPNDTWLGWELFSCEESRPPNELLRERSEGAQQVESLLPMTRCAMALGVLLIVLSPLVIVRLRRS